MWAFFCKTLPGLGISLALAIVLNLPIPSPRPNQADSPQRIASRPLPIFVQTDPADCRPHPHAINPIFTGIALEPLAPTPSEPIPDPDRQGVWSSNALASMAMPATADFCPPSPPPPHAGTHSLDLPAKGIYAWVDGEAATARMKKSRDGTNAFDVDQKGYTLGMKYDWSVDSVLGVSVSRLEADVESRRADDTRRNTVRGTVFSGHYDGYLYGKYPLALTASYGRLDTDGGGSVGGYRWREAERQSDYYALTARFGVPLIFRNRLKLLTEIGVDYRKLSTGGYDYTVDGVRFAAPGVSSESLRIPIDFTVRWDRPYAWGFLTTYAGCGLAVELNDSATGIRAWNASSASADRFAPGPGPVPMVTTLGYDPWKSVIGTVALGVEARTVGGWDLRADYRRTMASGFAENRFSLEVGRCF